MLTWNSGLTTTYSVVVCLSQYFAEEILVGFVLFLLQLLLHYIVCDVVTAIVLVTLVSGDTGLWDPACVEGLPPGRGKDLARPLSTCGILPGFLFFWSEHLLFCEL